ncbi:MAG: lycopene cyclase family protein, partial [Bacteroidota bacterium]
MKHDYIIAGAGLGGLSFIHHLLASNQEFSSVLIIDQKIKNINDRTWSFWLDYDPIYECAKSRSWKRLGFATDDYVHFETIDPYIYYTIHSHEFYTEVFDQINNDSRITFLQEGVSSIIPEKDLVRVTTTKDTYTAGYVIDSITHPVDIPSDTLMLAQNFVGWTIKTPYAAFDSENPILMDFRVSQESAPSFVYLLPYSESEALVEYTQFSAQFSYDKQIYENELNQYINTQLGIADFTVIEKEDGSIPMTNFEFDSRPHKRVFRI